MNTQINVRISDDLLSKAEVYAKKNGFDNVQQLMRESLRARINGEHVLSKKGQKLIERLVEVSNKEGWISEGEFVEIWKSRSHASSTPNVKSSLKKQ